MVDYYCIIIKIDNYFKFNYLTDYQFIQGNIIIIINFIFKNYIIIIIVTIIIIIIITNSNY